MSIILSFFVIEADVWLDKTVGLSRIPWLGLGLMLSLGIGEIVGIGNWLLRVWGWVGEVLGVQEKLINIQIKLSSF
jgi:hypothetical protein